MKLERAIFFFEKTKLNKQKNSLKFMYFKDIGNQSKTKVIIHLELNLKTSTIRF